MAVKPLALRKLEKQSKNIYEAVVVMSKRARQINQDRYEEKVINETDDISELDVLDELPQVDPDEYEEKEKVTETVECNGCQGEGKRERWETHYPFEADTVLEFAQFCKQSGGFSIC